MDDSNKQGTWVDDALAEIDQEEKELWVRIKLIIAVLTILIIGLALLIWKAGIIATVGVFMFIWANNIERRLREM